MVAFIITERKTIFTRREEDVSDSLDSSIIKNTMRQDREQKVFNSMRVWGWNKEKESRKISDNV